MAPADDVDDEDGDGQAQRDDASEGAERPEEEAQQDEPPEALEEPEVDEHGWFNLMDGKIRKKVLVPGTGRNPEMKQDVRCSLEIRLAGDVTSGGEPAPEVLQCYENFRYRIGEGEAVPMLELGLRYMKEGEEAELFGVSNMAWGPNGLKAASEKEKAIPSAADICMRVVLHEVLPMRDASAPEWNDLIQEVTWRKQSGNDHFKRQEFHRALRSYGAGVELFSSSGFEPPEHVEERQKAAARAAAMSLVTDCGANLAAVHLELGNPVAAKEAAAAVIDMCPEHVKGLYRMARACLLLDDFDACEDAVRRGLRVDADNAALQRVEAELRHKQKKYEEKSKRVAARLFQGLDYPEEPAKKPKSEAELQEEYEETWRGWAVKALREWFVWQIAVAILGSSVVLAVLLTLLPKRHWPMTLIAFVMLVPTGIGMWSASREPEQPSAAKPGKKKRA